MRLIYLKRNAIQTKHKAANPEQGRRIINEHNLLPLGANILIINILPFICTSLPNVPK
jgi:hypothetical protein